MQGVLNYILYTSLPKYISSHLSSPLYYPVVVGGFDVMRCVRKTEFMEALMTSDIDLDFVIRPRHDKKREEFERAVKEADVARNLLANSLVADKSLQDEIQKLMPGSNLMREQIADLSGKVVYRLILYHGEARYILMDISLFSSQNSKHFGEYINPNPNPIPYILHKQVPFATCNYVYYDTLRMLSWSKAQLMEPTLTEKSILFYFSKLLKYVMKYSALHIALKGKSPKHAKLFKESFKIFQEVQRTPNKLRKRLLQLVNSNQL